MANIRKALKKTSKKTSKKSVKKPQKNLKKKSSTTQGANAETILQLKRQLFSVERLRFEAERKLYKNSKSSAHSDSLLAAGVAHEFNNILGAAQGFAEWALDSGKPDDMKEALEKVLQACERSAEVTHALRGMSQPREDKKGFFSFSHIQNDLNSFFTQSGSLDIEFMCESILDTEIYGHPQDFFDILLNLLKNAKEAMQNIAASPVKPIQVMGSKTQKFIEIRVVDWGEGVNELYKSEIFKPFFTTKGVLKNIHSSEDRGRPLEPNSEHNSTPQESSPQGGGLGLYMSVEKASENGATLELESLGKPTVFLLRWPKVR